MKVSVIVPVYNVEKYVGPMLTSILEQTMQDFEIICVDDISNDKSCQVIEEYIQKDSRIKLIHPQNKVGAGEARNIGMRQAKSEFLVFLDGDDLFEKNMLEELYTAITKYDCDVAVAEHDQFYGEGEYIAGQAQPAISEYKKCRTIKYAQEAFSLDKLGWEGLIYWYPVPWNRMYRKSFIEKMRLEYQNVKCSNDIYFTSMAMMLAERIIHTESFDSLIHYRKNTSTQISYNRFPMCIYEAFRMIYAKMKEFNIYEKYAEAYYVRLLACLISEITKCRREDWAKQFYTFLRKSGLKELGVENNNQYWKIDDSIKEMYDLFYIYDYDSKWFETSAEMDMRKRLQSSNGIRHSFVESVRIKDISGLKELIKKKNWKTAVWGGGYKERKIAEKLKEEGISISAFYTDQNCEVQIENFVPQHYEIEDKCDIVIVATNHAMEKAYLYLRGIDKNISLFNMEKYCLNDRKAEEALESGEKEMENKIRVSVIIPVYNVEKYVTDCLNSIIGQTLKEIEIICVNDCSTDGSLNILKEYEKKDTRVVILENSCNQGLSATRNNGLSRAKGKYVYFLDSDDMLASNALEELYAEAEKKYADVIYFDCQPVFENERLKETFHNYRLTRTEKYPDVYTGRDLFVSFRRNWDWVSNVARLFIKKSLIDEEELVFYPGILHEDEIFTFLVMMKSERSLYMEKDYYIRRFREESITTVQKSKKNIEGLFVSMAEILRYRDSHEFSKAQMNAISAHVGNMYRNITRLYQETDFEQIYEDGLDCDNEYARILFWLFVSNTPREFKNKKWKEEVQEAGKIFIYGAGVYAEKAYVNLQNLNVELRGFLVTDKTNNPVQKYGIPVYEIDEKAEELEETAVVIGVSRKFYDDVKKVLSNYKLRKVIE